MKILMRDLKASKSQESVLSSAKLTGVGVGKVPNLNGGSESERRLQMTKQGRKEQKQVVVEHKTKIDTAACYFALEIGRK